MLTSTDKLRTKALEQYDIIDTVPEEMFDDITAIAASICNMPIAMINLANDQKLFFKSHFGIDGTEAPLEESVCKHVIRDNIDSFEVPDMRADIRFNNYESVINDPNFVSYYGVPLTVDKGVSIGTLCVVDYKVRKLTTDQKRAMKSLSHQVVHLLELRKSNKLLKKYQDKLERNFKNMEEFSYMAAHDLKAPIRNIGSFLKLIHQKNTESWDQKDKKYFDVIFNSCTQMNTMISDLLAFAKAGNDKESKEYIDLNKMIRTILKNFNADHEERKIILNMSNLPLVYNSEAALAMLFQNLIGNAIKYQPKDQAPEIFIDFSETNNNWKFSVKDNGLGIDQIYFNDIFKPFKRLHAQSEYQGTGLGLSGCKKALKVIGGKIWVESQLGMGSTFYFTIPKRLNFNKKHLSEYSKN